MIARILPHPLMSLAIFTMWLILAGTYTTASFVFAAILGLLLPPVMRPLEPEPVRLKRPLAMIKLTGVVLQDIVRSNIAVAAIILGRKKNTRTSDFIHVPIVMKSTYGLAVLSIIVTCTPGTLWVQYDPRRRSLLLHVLDLVDEEEWVKLVKTRYERLLMEIFE
ncbi:MAG: Na+/H+ antiporter subunit E [Bdellovibrionales bacterium]|jgi:multicomponent K+:H+ antiporter subunit E|nr:Na+/H+ antiporter subunit E [Bdellovibrionales bacterium]